MLIPSVEIIKKSINLYKENFNVFFQYALLFLIPNGVILALRPFLINATLNDTAQNSMLTTVYFLLILISWFASFWISAGLIRVLYAKYNGKEVKDIKTELLNVKHVLIPAFLATTLSAIFVMLGIVLFIIPGLIFSIWFAFSIHEAVINEKKVVDALKSSKELVTGRWIAVFWRLLVGIIVFGIATAITASIVGSILGVITSGIAKDSSIYTPVRIIVSLIVSFVSILFTPLTNGVLVILFSELQKTPKVAEVAQKK